MTGHDHSKLPYRYFFRTSSIMDEKKKILNVLFVFFFLSSGENVDIILAFKLF